MANSSSFSSGLHRLLDSIGQCSGSTFRVWKESFEHVINIHAPELLTVLRRSARPDALAATLADVTAWDKADSRLYSPLFFATTGSARITVQAHRKAGTSAEGNGQLAWAALNARFDVHIQEARRACHKELFALTHVAGCDPVDFFSKGCELKLRLETLGEKVSDEVYLDIMLSGLTCARNSTSSGRCTTETNLHRSTVFRTRPTASLWTSSRARRRGPRSRAGEPRWPRPAATSATAARSLDISSETVRSLRSRPDR